MSKDKHGNGLTGKLEKERENLDHYLICSLDVTEIFQNCNKTSGPKMAEENTWKFESYDGVMELWFFAGNTLLSLLMCHNGFFVNQTLLRLIVFVRSVGKRGVLHCVTLRVSQLTLLNNYMYNTFKKHLSKPTAECLLFIKCKFINKHPTGDI